MTIAWILAICPDCEAEEKCRVAPGSNSAGRVIVHCPSCDSEFEVDV